MGEYWWIVPVLAAALVAAAVGLLVWRPFRGRLREAQLVQARRDFHQQRERLEAKFLKLAAGSGKPRGLEWTGCEFDNDVLYVRDRTSGELSAFVAATISFAAIEGGGMEDVEAVSNLRAATAVFRMHQGHWSTDGRAIFNLNPAEAVRHFQQNLELVDHEVAHPTRS